MPDKRHAVKRGQRRNVEIAKVKLDRKIFTDPAERAECEALIEKEADEYGNEFFAALVEAMIKRGELTTEEGEKRKKDFAKQLKTPKRKS
jgi:hypothetical protein